jgi:7,8-dihydropterin-6-yl-methyl-4-(beta-D-ribofuranosyl)aminobenzene 5'-phosphate synthase
MTIVVLSDNSVSARGLRGEHGLALWIDTGDHRLLFDTGQGLVLTDNARALGVDLESVDAIVLSHGHYDHTAGLCDVPRATGGPRAVYAHPDALQAKYRRTQDGVRDIGMPDRCRAAILGGSCRLASSRGPMTLAPGLRTTGEIPRRHSEETIDEGFARDPDGRDADLVPDDQALFMETARGTVILLGCAHAGVINTLDHVQDLTDTAPVRAVIGGMHLRSAGDGRLSWTIRELRRFDIPLLAPMHCTGPRAAAAIWTAFPTACRPAGAGSTFEL